MHTRTGLAFSVAMFLLASNCATKYQPKGFTGGFSEVQLTANIFNVSFRGNGYTSKQKVEAYMLYRCAELTEGAGYDYFVIVSGDSDTTHGTVTTPGTYTGTTTATTSGTYSTARTAGTYTPGQTIQVTKHGATATIQMFKGKIPPDIVNAYRASELKAFVGPKIKR